MKSPFLMNMKSREFSSNGQLSIRAWFGRMVDQLESNAFWADLSWNSAEMSIIMHPNVWDCIAYIYANYQLGIFTLPEKEVQIYRTEYMSSRALPIGGRLYPVILDSQISQVTNQGDVICSDIYFVTTRIGGEAIIQGKYQDLKPLPGKPCLSGVIQNVYAKEMKGMNDPILYKSPNSSRISTGG
jgi:hypothetical protein